MRTLVVIGGAAPEHMPFRDAYDMIVAADSGLDTALDLGIRPDEFVGDGDSTALREELSEKGTAFASVKKDDTDFTLAVKRTDGDYDLIGGGEGRLDHTLGIFSTFINDGAPVKWATREEVMLSGKEFDIELPPDTLISFFPVNLMKGSTVSTEGLEWDVTDRNIDLSFFSLSNRTVSEKVHISASESIFVRIPLSAWMRECRINIC